MNSEEVEVDSVGLAREKVLERISEIVEESWQRQREPVLLSYIGLQLTKEGIQYREVSPRGQLRALMSDFPSRFEITVHPNMPLKIGAVPPNTGFEYPQEVVTEMASMVHGSEEISERVKKSRGALYTFIRELSKLSKEDANSVVIPTSVLIKLLEGK